MLLQGHSLVLLGRYNGYRVRNSAVEFIDFWMNSVHTHLIERRQKDGDKQTPPVIVVCAKTDLLHKVNYESVLPNIVVPYRNIIKPVTSLGVEVVKCCFLTSG